MQRSIYHTLIVLLIVAAGIASAKGKGDRPASAATGSGIPGASLMNINNISAWYSNNGQSERNPVNGNSGLTFPRGTATANYASGLMFGAVASDGISGSPRVTGFSYNTGFAPGAIIGTRTGVVENPSDPSVRMYRIRKDYATADLKKDAAEYLMKSELEVTDADIQALRQQYRTDWAEWPASKGAPFYDANNDGVYTPQFETVGGKEVPKVYPTADEPGLANADQVLWYVSNDIGVGQSPWKTQPLGLEQQVTVWGYAAAGVTQNIVYKKYKLIYKGTSSSLENSKLNDAYIAHWSDPDLGNAGDDFVGCDTTLSVGYVYNGLGLDDDYKKFNVVPPALGYDFLQGPTVPSAGDTAVVDLKKRAGLKNLPMTSFVYFAAGGFYSDPPFSVNGSVQWYQMLRGLPPTPQGPPSPNPITDPVSMQETRYWLPGDPVTRTGWIDGKWELPGDRRMIQSSGPFTMALNDTQEIVIGVVAGVGHDNLNSITVMKEADRSVQMMYNSLFTIIPPAITSTVTYSAESTADVRVRSVGPKNSYSSVTASIGAASAELYDDGTHGDSLASDGVYTNTITVPRSVIPVAVDLQFTTKSGAVVSIPNAKQQISVIGPVSVSAANILFDNVNNNGVVNNGEYVEYTLSLVNNAAADLSGIQVVLTDHSFLSAQKSVGTIAKGTTVATLTTSPFALRLPVLYSSPVHTVSYHITDDKGNLWDGVWNFPVVQATVVTDSVTLTAANVIGKNDAGIATVVFDRTIAGKSYEIWFGGYGAGRSYTVIDPANIRLTAALAPSSVVATKKATGTAEFTINAAKTQAQYTVTVKDPYAAVTGATIVAGASGVTGADVYPLTATGTNAFGGTWNIPDSLVDDLIAGNLYVNILTSANPAGESRGQIADGLIKRVTMANTPVGPAPSIYQMPENKLTGFSLYVSTPPGGMKSVMQTAPTVGSVLDAVNPEGKYRIVDQTNARWFGKQFNEDVSISFNAGTNYALALLKGAAPSGGAAFLMKVPFAVYKDTTRVWPVILDGGKDSAWNTRGNTLVNGKPVFDLISGIADVTDASSTNLRYYATGTVLGVSTKSRLISSANWLTQNISVVNESSDSIPPSAGTVVVFKQYQAVVPGDVKSFSLKTLGVVEQINTVPSTFDVSQNYPNPFNPSTTIEFAVPARAAVEMKVYDVVGREVAVLVKGEFNTGRYRTTWDGRSSTGRPVSSGVYFCRVQSGSLQKTIKMLLMK